MQKSIHTVQHAQLRVLLREARRDAGLTQAQLAEKLDIPQAVISNVERGERRLDLVELSEYCGAIGIDLAAFVVRFQKMCGSAGEASEVNPRSSSDAPASPFLQS